MRNMIMEPVTERERGENEGGRRKVCMGRVRQRKPEASIDPEGRVERRGKGLRKRCKENKRDEVSGRRGGERWREERSRDGGRGERKKG